MRVDEEVDDRKRQKIEKMNTEIIGKNLLENEGFEKEKEKEKEKDEKKKIFWLKNGKYYHIKNIITFLSEMTFD